MAKMRAQCTIVNFFVIVIITVITFFGVINLNNYYNSFSLPVILLTSSSSPNTPKTVMDPLGT